MNHPASQNDPVSKLVFELSKLPGIGERTAVRLAYVILKKDAAFSQSLAEAILNAKRKTQLCECCFNFTDSSPCQICSNEKRSEETICVVERPSDVMSIEKTGVHSGKYHVLHGVLSPLDGIGPNDLKISELLSRIQNQDSSIREVILATNPTVEGEATGLYLAKLLKPLGVKASKLAYGIPMGGQLEYTDHQTISRALENRVEIET